jgi:post-segregation antitoxin (ccd killing protein)
MCINDPQVALMTATQTQGAPRPQRRPINVSLDRALVEAARSLGINLSQTFARGIADPLAKTRAEQWLDENRASLACSDRFVAACRLQLAGLRRF